MKGIDVYYKSCQDMSELPDKFVHVMVGSPPYYGLRDYGTEPEIWGGDSECDHDWGEKLPEHHPGQVPDNKAVHSENASGQTKGSGKFCKKCDAWKGELGLEPTPELYIEHMVEIFREVKRVLRDDGTIWIVVGDSYWANRTRICEMGGVGWNAKVGRKVQGRAGFGKHPTIKPKDLIGIPWRLALALQADGWYLRSDVIWSKPNPMPSSVNGWRWEQHRIKKDNVWSDCPGCDKCNSNDGLILRKGSWRPTTSHEYIFQLSKTDSYYGDIDTVREPYLTADDPPRSETFNGSRDKAKADGVKIQTSLPQSRRYTHNGRNKRSVWRISTRPYPEAHFATFPEEIPKLCIMASTSHMACPHCGAPFARIVDINRPEDYTSSGADLERQEGCGGEEFMLNKPLSTIFKDILRTTRSTLGWKETCKCENNDGSGQCVVLDPFAGSGTTLWVAHKLKRKAIGYEKNPKYKELIDKRCHMNSRDVEELF